MATFSPHRDAGGAIHFPTHAGLHQVDPSSAIRQLRRSLSRSPSKTSAFSLLSTRSHGSPSRNSPYTPSPLSPSRKPSVQNSNFVLFPTSTPPPFAVPYPPSAKAVRPMVRRQRSTHKTPSERALNVSTNQGNVTPGQQQIFSAAGEENMPSTPMSGPPRNGQAESTCTNNTTVSTEPAAPPPKQPLSIAEKRRSGNFGSYLAASPMKRSDGINESRGSPSAKRRSIQTTEEFNIFEKFENDVARRDNLDEPMDEPATAQNNSQNAALPPQPLNLSPALPRRSSSLRRSTVQQRQSDRSIFARPRLTSETFVAPYNFGPESPFSSRQCSSGGGSLFTANSTNNRAQTSQRSHPLSRTITQSSSGSSFTDESPTHEPAHKSDRPRATIPNLSKSLPIGASRPMLARQLNREESTSSTDSFATPENYKHAKPLPSAFMSTGLISKKNRNAEDPDGSLGSSRNMPDTPCGKRTVNPFPAGPPKVPPTQPKEAPKFGRLSFDIPVSPLNLPTRVRPKPGPIARGMSIFDSIFNRPEPFRRNSAVSLEDDEHALSRSPSAINDKQRFADCDLPPTPTKQAFFPSKTFPPSQSHIASFEGFSANCKC